VLQRAPAAPRRHRDGSRWRAVTRGDRRTRIRDPRRGRYEDRDGDVPERPPRPGRWQRRRSAARRRVSVVSLEHATDHEEYGGKAVHLGAAIRAGLPVPPGVAVSVAVLSGLVRAEPGAIAALERAVVPLGGPVACRSSAIGEDGKASSFAGQHLTLLNVLGLPATIDALRRV